MITREMIARCILSVVIFRPWLVSLGIYPSCWSCAHLAVFLCFCVAVFSSFHISSLFVILPFIFLSDSMSGVCVYPSCKAGSE